MGDAADLVRDEVEVVEEPFGGRRDRLGVPDVVCDGAIGLLEHPRLLAQALQVAGSGPPGAAWVGLRQLDGELSGKGLQACQVQRIATRGVVVNPRLGCYGRAN